MAHNVRDLEALWFKYSLPNDQFASDKTVGTAALRLVIANARRLKVRFINNGTDIVSLGYDATVTTTTGVPVPPGQIAEFDWQEDYEEVTREFWGVSATAGNPLHITEHIMTATPDRPLAA